MINTPRAEVATETALGSVTNQLIHMREALYDQRGSLTAERERIDANLHDVEDAIAAVEAGLKEADVQRSTPKPVDPLDRRVEVAVADVVNGPLRR